MAHDMFLKIDGVRGSAKLGERSEWIHIHGFSHSIELPLSGSATGGDVGAGRAAHGDFIVSKDLDVTSPRLAMMCCAGEKISRVTMEICDSSRDQRVFMRYDMSEVLVRRVAPELTNPVDTRVLSVARESIALRYGRIRWEFIDPNDSDHYDGGDAAHYWDAEANLGG